MQLPNHNNYSLAHFRSRTHSLALHYQLAGHLGQRHSDHPVHLRSVGLAARLRWIAERLFGLLYVLTGCEECCLYVVSPVKSTQASKPRLHTAKTRLRTQRMQHLLLLTYTVLTFTCRFYSDFSRSRSENPSAIPDFLPP